MRGFPQDKSLMTLTSPRDRFDLRWTLLGSWTVLVSSPALLRLSWPSASFVAMVICASLASGLSARRLTAEQADAKYFQRAQLVRMAIAPASLILAAALNGSNRSLLLLLAAVALWLVSISSFLQIAYRHVPD